jgi:hypothetical protein
MLQYSANLHNVLLRSKKKKKRISKYKLEYEISIENEKKFNISSNKNQIVY